jgi:ferritin
MVVEIKNLLDKQVELELTSQLFYLRIALNCKVKGYEGLYKFFMKQSEEERTHMLKILEFLTEMGVEHNFKYEIGEVCIPDSFTEEFDIRVLFLDSLEMEREVTSNIRKIADLSFSRVDHDTYEFIQWFVKEQREEENKFDLLVQKSNLLKNNSVGLYLLDQELKNS